MFEMNVIVKNIDDRNVFLCDNPKWENVGAWKSCIFLIIGFLFGFCDFLRDLKDQIQSLGPKQSVLYTWQDPVMKRELVWMCGEKKDNKDELVKVGSCEIAWA